MKELGNHRQVLKGETNTVRFVCSEYPRSLANWQWLPFTPVTVPSGKSQPNLSPQNSSVYAYKDQIDSFFFSWPTWTRCLCLLASILLSIPVIIPPPTSILSTVWHYVLLPARYCPRSWGSNSLGIPILVDRGILYRKQEIIGKKSIVLVHILLFI